MYVFATVMLRDFLATCWGELLSATWTVNENVPMAVGVPLSTPAGLKLIPVGNGAEPEASDQTYGEIPPLAASVCV